MTKEENQQTEAAQNQMPVLYNRIVPLMSDLHKNLKMDNSLNFSFAANVNAVPVVMQELAIAGKHYPIVFASDAPGVMLAVLGIKNGQNLFVDDKGNWKENTYIPTYIRRYPFFIARPDENSEPVICIDEESSFFSSDGNMAMFEDGKPTEDLNRIIEFTRLYQQQLELTNEFGQKVNDQGLLEDQRVSFKAGEEVLANVDGFQTINRTKFDELDGDTLKEWLGKNWLDSCILHLATGSNFDILWKMDRLRNT